MKPEITTLNEYLDSYNKSKESPNDFWMEIALKQEWVFRPKTVQNGNFSDGNTQWFEGGQFNLCYNCVDRHLPKLNNKPAIIWEANDPLTPSRTITYLELFKKVQHFSNVLAHFGVHQGDRVGIYMPMIPEALIAMLACARMGAVHTVVFAGFSAQSLSDRLNDSGCTVLITADSFFRGEKEIKLKEIADSALESCPNIHGVIVYNHTNCKVNMKKGRDHYWEDMLSQNLYFYFPAQICSNSPAFILYTSGSTGKPKGIVHNAGGYMVYTSYTFRNVFQLKDDDIFWCTADIGWITGHSYLLYGALLNGCTTVIYEGNPTFPDNGRCWDIIEKHKVTILYTSPTLIRTLEGLGNSIFENKDISTLRVLGTVGEPINQEAWEWYDANVGKNRLPIVDTWWQTETGGIMISSLANVTPSIPTFATLPLPGVFPAILDENGNEIVGEGEGILVLKNSWPGLAQSIWGNPQKFIDTYFSNYSGYYFTGDGAKRDLNGNYRITGRVDDIINVSGHRIGTAEIENIINQHPLIVESAVVGYHHPIKGQAIYAFITPIANEKIPNDLFLSILNLVILNIGSFAKPDKIQIANSLPKTRSGKIMRRVLRKIVEGETKDFGDTSTLLDPNVIEDLVKGLVK